MFTFMAQFNQDQKIIIFSHSLALTIFQPIGPLGVLRMGGTYQLYSDVKTHLRVQYTDQLHSSQWKAYLH